MKNPGFDLESLPQSECFLLHSAVPDVTDVPLARYFPHACSWILRFGQTRVIRLGKITGGVVYFYQEAHYVCGSFLMLLPVP